MIVKAEEKPTKTGGVQLVVEFKVIEGKFKNRTIFNRINLQNANKQAELIGAGQLSALSQACNIKVLRSAHELANKTVRVAVKVKADSRTAGAFQNEVSRVAAMGGSIAPVPAAPVLSTDAPPWN